MRPYRALVLAAALAAPAAAQAPPPAPAPANPCENAALRLRCPDITMGVPDDLHLKRAGRRRLLQSTNRLINIGRGPLEVRGTRTGKREMGKLVQVIRTSSGHKRRFASTGELYFTLIKGQGGYWKYRNAARFELWRLDSQGKRTKLAKTGPKLNYCFRDYEPRKSYAVRIHYGGCKQNPRLRHVTLGTSRGWSDTYPFGYAGSNYIDVTGLRGCFAFDHVADRKNGIHEAREDNNVGTRTIRLPYRGGGRRGCPQAERRPT